MLRQLSKMRGSDNDEVDAADDGAHFLEAEAADIMCCASCGIAEVDDIKLKECNDCDLVRYCSDECQQDHRPQHEAMCKERVAELRNEILFRQPESSHLGDCPICFLPLSIDTDMSMLQSCCSKTICRGCVVANIVCQRDKRQDPTCPFCRKLLPNTEEEANKNVMKRVAANDPAALSGMGRQYSKDGDYDVAFRYWTKAAEMGDVNAHYHLSLLYQEGKGVEEDEEKELYHLEEAAIGGHPFARYNLAIKEGDNKKFDRAVKHWIIAANLGYDESIQALKDLYKDGLVSKEDFAAALRAHHAAVIATKSPQREAAAEAMQS
eukprot:scaffold9984_cov148-Skeletonema_dohrnii-CCMP3373.AAC.10